MEIVCDPGGLENRLTGRWVGMSWKGRDTGRIIEKYMI